MINLNHVKCTRNREFADDDVNELAQSIGNIGLLQPLVMREIEPDENGCCYEVLAGRRRYEALLKLKRYELDENDYRIIDSIDPELVSFVENFERKNLTLTEEIVHLAELRETYTPAELSGFLGRTEKYVRRRLQLRNLNEKFSAALAKHEFPMLNLGHYEIISKYPASVQSQIFGSWMVHNPGSIDHFEKNLAAEYSHLLASAPFDTAGCVCCLKRSLAEPWLFEELKDSREDRCLDPECYKRNQQKAIKAALKKNKGKITPVTMSYNELPPGLENVDHLTRNQFDIVEKDVQPDHANAFIIDGPGAGAYCRITVRGGAAADDPPRPKTMDEKRGELSKRRIKAALMKLSDYLNNEQKLPQRPSPDMLLKLAALNGLDPQYDFGGIENRHNIPIDKVMNAVWDYLVVDFSRQIKNLTNALLPCINDEYAREVCEICGLDWKVFVKEATAEIPEPKNWTAGKAKE